LFLVKILWNLYLAHLFSIEFHAICNKYIYDSLKFVNYYVIYYENMFHMLHVKIYICTLANKLGERTLKFLKNMFLRIFLNIQIMPNMIKFIFIYLWIYVELFWNILEVSISSLIRNLRIFFLNISICIECCNNLEWNDKVNCAKIFIPMTMIGNYMWTFDSRI